MNNIQLIRLKKDEYLNNWFEDNIRRTFEKNQKEIDELNESIQNYKDQSKYTD